MTPRAIRAGIIGCALLAGALFTAVALESQQWVGRIVPGFFVLPNRVIPSAALPDWLEIEPARLFQHEIVAVDGAARGSADAIYAYVGAQPDGARIRYTLRRADGSLTVETVPTRRFSGADYGILFGSYLLTGGVFLLIGLLALWLRPSHPASVGLCSVGVVTGIFAITGADLYGPAAFMRLHVIAESLIAPSYLHLALVFPVDRLRTGRRRALGAIYLPFVALAVMYEVVRDHPDAYRTMHLLASLLQGMALFAAIGLMVFAAVSSRAPLVRRRIAVVVFGAVTGFLLPAVLSGASGLLGGQVPVNGGALTAFLFPICVGYAVIKQDLFEIELMLRRALTYAVLGVLMALACGLALIGLREVLPGRERLLTSPVVFVALNVALLAVAALLRQQVRRGVDRFLSPEPYDSAAALATLGHRLAAVRTVDAVVTDVEEILAETMAPAGMAILEARENHHYVPIGSSALPAPVTITGSLASRLAGGESLARYDWDDGSGRPVPAIWDETGADLMVPIRGRDTMLGLLALQPKRSGRPYGANDLAFLHAAADQVALALTNARAMERLAEDATVSSALLRVQRAVVFSLDTPDMLERLCEITAEVLDCDCSHTLLWQSSRNAYVLIAGHGDTAAQRDMMRTVHVPRGLLVDVLARLEHDDVAAGARDDAAPDVIQALLRYGRTRSMTMALRRGEELVGLHVAGSRATGQRPFTAPAMQIARGIAQAASMALANARLVEELEAANRIKSDFVASMSHELRTPLNHIIGYNDLLIDGSFGPVVPEQAEVLRRVRKSSRGLLDLIEATLDLSRLESGGIVLDERDVSVPDLIHELAHHAEHVCNKPGVQRRFTVHPGVAMLRTDPVKLEMILKNLLDNALKFTARGEVVLEVRAHADGVEFAVRDTGIGIPPESCPAIFEPFHRAHGAAAYDGVGLGLHIVKRLTDALGGTITAESAVDRGSCFRLWLPLRRPAPAAVTAVPDQIPHIPDRLDTVFRMA